MLFGFATATEILFGRGQVDILPPRIARIGQRVLLVHGSHPARSDNFRNGLILAGCEVAGFSVPAEPEMALIEAGVAQAREFSADVIVSFGGGAVIDAGKAIAALVPAARPMIEHLEVVGQGLPLDHPPLPFVAIPTTAGTGAEVTRNAVIGVPEHRRKVSLRDARMLPLLAVVDPSLCDHCPRSVTLASGLDAITQVIEPYVCTRANPLTDALCRDTILRGLRSLRRLMEAENPDARNEMAWVSLCGGLALANSGLGAVHGLAGPLGGLTGAAHGAICGVLLPHVLTANRRLATDQQYIDRLDEVGRWIAEVFGGEDLNSAASALSDWSQQSGLLRLSQLGINTEAQQLAAQSAATSSSMKANPAMLSSDDLMEIMRASG